jgi:hypothetical protein
MDGDDDYSEDETGSSSHSTPRRCRWGVQNCRPDVVEASLRSDLLEINNSAGAVREKVQIMHLDYLYQGLTTSQIRFMVL